jgi:hypothetical protein
LRLDFVLAGWEPGSDAPMVAANLWSTTDEEHEQAQADATSSWK